VLEIWMPIFRSTAGRQLSIVGHTDSTGDKAYNLDLSRRRAVAVQAWLIGHGVVGAMFAKVEGKGETDPIASNRTKEGRERNRRVELRLDK
jgi:OmpA-OmpF porin, OOP family